MNLIFSLSENGGRVVRPRQQANSTKFDNKVSLIFRRSFVQVQNILNQNRLLISEINQNHESKIPDDLSRNAGLIRELNNIRRVVDLYSDLLNSFGQVYGC